MAVSLDQLRKLCKAMTTANPGDHFHTLGLQFTHVEKGRTVAELPYSKEIVGNPETGVIHGGALTALLDTCCGFAAASALDELTLCPTMDLRVDYMHSAEPGQPVYAEAEAYRVTRHVVFCRGVAYQEDKNNPIAHCTANFSRLDPEVSAVMNEQLLAFLETMD